MGTRKRSRKPCPGADGRVRRAPGTPSLTLDYSYMMEETIGEGAGLSHSSLRLGLARARRAQESLLHRRGPGTEKTGWIGLPEYWSSSDGARELRRLEALARRMRRLGDRHLILGIGGSSVGARAILGAFSPLDFPHPSGQGHPAVYFAGHNLDADQLGELLDFLVAGARARRDPHPFTVEVVSKSGGTLETAVAFRFARQALSRLYGKSAAERIVAITDPEEGLLREMARHEGYETLSIPPDVGGRYSVLSAVGLFPAAVAGVDVRALIRGASAMAHTCREASPEDNNALLYATLMHLSAEAGRQVTYLYCWGEALFRFGQWHDQLVAESLGKDGKGRVPVASVVPRDLHARGQEVQEGPRHAVVAHLRVERRGRVARVPREKTDHDGLGYLAGKSLDDLLRAAFEGTALAYVVDARPNLTLRVPKLDPSALGELFMFFEWATAVEGLLLGVNPFDQPGVEGYKSFMYSLLGRSDQKGMERKLRALGQRPGDQS